MSARTNSEDYPESRASSVDPLADLRAVIPTPVRMAGWIATVQGLAGVGVGVLLVVRALSGHREETVAISSYGTALWFAIIGGGVLSAGIGLLRGRRWGRGLVVIAEILLLFVSWYLGVGSGRPLAGIALAALAAFALVSLFRREAITWYLR